MEKDQQARDSGELARGVQALTGEFGCTDCHKLGENGELGMAPDLTGWGSAAWLRRMIAQPEHESLYGYPISDDQGGEKPGNDRMPAFAANPESPERNLLNDHEIEMLARWLRGDDRDLQ